MKCAWLPALEERLYHSSFLDSYEVQVVPNPDYRNGKTTSVRAGVRAISATATAIVILAVDQPRPDWVIRRVVSSHRLDGRSGNLAAVLRTGRPSARVQREA